jgi:hypothetical protein
LPLSRFPRRAFFNPLTTKFPSESSRIVALPSLVTGLIATAVFFTIFDLVDLSILWKPLGPSIMGAYSEAFLLAFELSRDTMRIIRQNLAWAAAYNAAAIPLAAVGWITPLAAGVGMALSSLVVVGNALRLRRPVRRLPPSSAGAVVVPV